jgi:hypothetical protein
MGMWLLLALCLSVSPAWAISSQKPAWKQNIKVGVEVGFGAPYGWAITKEDIKEKGWELDNIQVSPNWRFGTVWGYGFPCLDDTLAIGPDIGLFLGAKRKCGIFFPCGTNITLKEQYLHVPLALKLATFDKETGVQEGGLILGYEFNILLSSECSPSSSSLSAEHNAMLERANDIKNVSKLGGSIFLGGKIDLFAGCYFVGQFKFPITDFLGLKEDDEVKSYFHAARIACASLAELSLGFNIMKWL